MLQTIQPPVQDRLVEISKLLNDLAIKLTGNRHDANDLYQDTALRIISKSDKFTPGSNFRAWAVTIMRNIFINNYRKKQRRNLFHDKTKDGFFLNHGGELDENHGESNLAYDELMKLIDKLPKEFQNAFLLRLQGYKYEEIAEELDTPIGTVKSRIFFAKRKLRKQLQIISL